MTEREALKLTLEALKQIDAAMPFPVAKLAIKKAEEALAQPEQEPVAGVSNYECRRLLYAFMLECNAFGLFEAAENLHKGMKQAAKGAR